MKFKNRCKSFDTEAREGRQDKCVNCNITMLSVYSFMLNGPGFESSEHLFFHILAPVFESLSVTF